MCFLKTDDRVRRFFVQVWKICLSALAFFPMLSLVSVLGLALPTFLLSIFFSKDITLSILEIIILLFLIVFYLKLFSKIRNSKIAILTYWCISISTLIIFFLIDLKLVIIFQFALILIYALKYINRFNKFRDFLTKSTESLAFINVFDGIFCGILIYFLQNLNLVESILINVSQYFLTNYGISENQINNWFSILTILILPSILSTIKSIVSIKIFKKVNKVDVPKGRTLWNVYATMFITSFLWYYIYLYYFFF